MKENNFGSISPSADLNVDNKHVKLMLAVLVGFIPLWLMSALLHLSDPDVSGIYEFTQFSILLSVTVWAVILFLLPTLSIIAAQIAAKTKGYIIGLLLVSVATAFFLTLASRGGALFTEILMPTGFNIVVFGAATYPVVWVLNRYFYSV